MRAAYIFPRLWLVCLAPLLAGATLPVTPSGLPVSGGDAARAQATARMVRGIIEYTGWPVRSDPLQLCVAGPAEHAGLLDGLVLADGRRVQRRTMPPAAISADCRVVYVGQIDPLTARQLMARLRGKGVLTIAEADPGCRSQAMVCLQHMPGQLSFQLNLDAVSRSGVRIDPRVLRLTREGGGL